MVVVEDGNFSYLEPYKYVGNRMYVYDFPT